MREETTRTDTMIRGGDAPVPRKKAPWKRGLKESKEPPTTQTQRVDGTPQTTDYLGRGKLLEYWGSHHLNLNTPPGAVSGKPYKEAENIRDK